MIKRKRRILLVFEFVDQTVLDELEQCARGMPEEAVRRIIFQVLRGIDFCHNHNVSAIHLLSKFGKKIV